MHGELERRVCGRPKRVRAVESKLNLHAQYEHVLTPDFAVACLLVVCIEEMVRAYDDKMRAYDTRCAHYTACACIQQGCVHTE